MHSALYYIQATPSNHVRGMACEIEIEIETKYNVGDAERSARFYPLVYKSSRKTPMH